MLLLSPRSATRPQPGSFTTVKKLNIIWERNPKLKMDLLGLRQWSYVMFTQVFCKVFYVILLFVGFQEFIHTSFPAFLHPWDGDGWFKITLNRPQNICQNRLWLQLQTMLQNIPKVASSNYFFLVAKVIIASLVGFHLDFIRTPGIIMWLLQKYPCLLAV